MRIRTALARTAATLILALGALHARAADDVLYVSNLGDNSVRRFDARTGAPMTPIVPAGANGLLGPQGLVTYRNRLHVVNQNVDEDFASEVQRYRADGTFDGAVVACKPTLGRPCAPGAPFVGRGVVRDGGTLYVGDYNLFGVGRVARFDQRSGGFQGDLNPGGFTGAFFPRGLVFGPDGMLYVSVTGNLLAGDGLSGHVLRFDPRTGRFLNVYASNQHAGCATHLHRPEGLVFDRAGNLYVTAYRADATDIDRILVFKRGGQCVGSIDLYQAGQPRVFPQAIVFGPKGKLFVPIQATGEVRRYDVKTKTFDVFVPAGGNVGPSYVAFGRTRPDTMHYDD